MNRLLLIGIIAVLFLGACSGKNRQESNLSAEKSVTSQTVHQAPGVYHYQNGAGMAVKLEVEPAGETYSDWKARISLHASETKNNLMVSINAYMTNTCDLRAEESNSISAVESKDKVISWKVDMQPNQALVLEAYLENCGVIEYGLIAELRATAMTQDLNLITDFVTIFAYEDHWNLVRKGTPWPTQTYDPLMPGTPPDFDEPVTIFLGTTTPIATPPNTVETLIYEFTQRSSQNPTLTLTTPTPEISPIPYP